MQFCFVKDNQIITLPITPSGYTWTTGINIESVNISQIGDVNLPGGKTSHRGAIDCIFPAQVYSFCEPGAVPNPMYYIKAFEAWIESKTPVRLIVTGAEINALVYIAQLQWAERDGSGDVYAQIDIRECVELTTLTVPNSGTISVHNDAAPSGGRTQSYVIAASDTLSAICRRFYGNSTATYYNALAKYNAIANPNLIYPGRTISIPPAATLLEGRA